MTDLLSPRGLRNETGQNNCFLNVVVQTLVHVRSFRRALGRIKGSSSSQLVRSLQTLFAFYKYSEQRVLPPDEVRAALSALHAHKDGRFALGDMDDANEAFEAILNQIHRDACGTDDDETTCSPPCAAHYVFGFSAFDQHECPACRATSEPQATLNYVYRVSVFELLKAAPSDYPLRCARGWLAAS